MHAFRLESLRRHPINAVYDVPCAVGHPVRPALESGDALSECRAVRTEEFQMVRNEREPNELHSRHAPHGVEAAATIFHQDGERSVLASL